MPLTNVDLDRIDGNSGRLSNVVTAALNGGPLAGARNRIINGDMRIDQRNAGASVTPTNGQYTIDRWVAFLFGGGVYSVQRSATAPAGFTNSLLLTATTADSSIASGDYYMLRQYIEGFNVDDLAWGSASAKTITLSFWVRSSITGTYGGSLNNDTAARSYPFTYVINAANTWEYKTITVSGDTGGTWLTNNSTGLMVGFSLGMGSTYTGTAGAWANTNYVSATGSTNWISNSGATFYITGVQLEAGTVATPFERRSYGQELALCQRYYYRVVSNNASNSYARLSIWGQCSSSTGAFVGVLFPVSMRTAPTALETTGTASNYALFSSSGSGVAATAVTFNAASAHSGEASVTAASGLTAGNATILHANNNTTAYLGWSAEL